MALEKGTTLAGYEITGILGQGGMGIVYEATQISLNRTVALKVLAPHLSEDILFRERFKREGQIQAGMDHANIVTVYEAGESEHGFFIAMRLIRGPNLKDMIVARELDPGRTLRILGPIAQALDSAHEAGLIHRDIKPQNILVGRRDQAFLADFGLTKASGEKSLTRTGQFVGTFDYISPEQIKGERATTRSDVYALTAVLYECLTGVVPFPKDSEAALLYAQMADPPPKVTEQRPELPTTLDAVIATGMSKDPTERYASPGELLFETNRAFSRRMRAALTPPRPIEAPQETGIRDAEVEVPTREAPASEGQPSTEEAALEADTLSPSGFNTTVPSAPPPDVAPPETPPSETAPAASAAPPVETAPGEAPPAETAPGGAPPAETAPSGAPPAETARGGGPPAETAPGAPPGETAPSQTPPAETAPGAPPAETAPGRTVPGQPTPGETPPGETAPGETAPGETAPGELVPEVTRASDLSPDVTRPADATPHEPPPGERGETPVTAIMPDAEPTRPGAARATRPGGAGAGAAAGAGAGRRAAARAPGRPARERRRPVQPPVLIGAGLLLLVLAVAGFLLGHSGGGDTEKAEPAATNSASAGGVELNFASDWKRAASPAEIPGLDLQSGGGQITLTKTGSPRAGTLNAGLTNATGPALLRSTFLDRLGEAPARDDAVKLGDIDMYRYSDLTPKGFDGRLTLYVAPTTQGVATIACAASAGSAKTFLPACESAADGIRLTSADTFPLGADEDYLGKLSSTIDDLNSAVTKDAASLRKAKKRAGQAQAANALAKDYGAAGKSLRGLDVSPAVADAAAAVRRALAQTQSAYERLGAAAKNSKQKAYDSARKNVASGQQALKKALRQVDEAS